MQEYGKSSLGSPISLSLSREFDCFSTSNVFFFGVFRIFIVRFGVIVILYSMWVSQKLV